MEMEWCKRGENDDGEYKSMSNRTPTAHHSCPDMWEFTVTWRGDFRSLASIRVDRVCGRCVDRMCICYRCRGCRVKFML